MNNNFVFCSLRVKDVYKKSKYPKGIHSTVRDKLLNIHFRSTDVYKSAAGLVKPYTLKKLLTIKMLTMQHYKYDLSNKYRGYTNLFRAAVVYTRYIIIRIKGALQIPT